MCFGMSNLLGNNSMSCSDCFASTMSCHKTNNKSNFSPNVSICTSGSKLLSPYIFTDCTRKKYNVLGSKPVALKIIFLPKPVSAIPSLYVILLSPSFRLYTVNVCKLPPFRSDIQDNVMDTEVSDSNVKDLGGYGKPKIMDKHYKYQQKNS